MRKILQISKTTLKTKVVSLSSLQLI